MQNYPLLNKLERKLGRFALRHLMLIIVIITAAVWLLEQVVYYETGVSIYGYLMFSRYSILQGEVWRLITFVFVPMNEGLGWFVLSMYFYCLIGGALESEWGAFRFGVFYFCGVVFSIAAGFITGFVTAEYIHLSLFLAFAILSPNYEMLFFFFIPLKVKYLALLDVLLLALSAIGAPWFEWVAMVVALLNVVLFFWRDLLWMIGSRRRSFQYKKQREKEEREYRFPEELQEREKKQQEKENKRKAKKEKQRQEENKDFPFEL